MKRAFFQHFGLGAIVFLLAASDLAFSSDLVPVYTAPPSEIGSDRQLLGGVPYVCGSPMMAKLQATYPDRDYTCHNQNNAKPGDGSLHMKTIDGVKNGTEGYMYEVDYNKFEDRRAATIKKLPAQPQLQKERAAPSKDPDQMTESDVGQPTPLVATVAQPIQACPDCGKQTTAHVDKLKPDSQIYSSKIQKECFLSMPCSAGSANLNGSGVITVSEQNSPAQAPYQVVSSDGSGISQPKIVSQYTVKGKNGRPLYVVTKPPTLCKVEIANGCGERGEGSPQRDLADRIFEPSSRLFDKYANCIKKNDPRFCEPEHKVALHAEAEAIPLCRAATEAFYNFCDPESKRDLDSRRAHVHAQIDSIFEKYKKTSFAKGMGRALNPNLMKCVAERENPAYQPYRMNLTACSADNSSTAVGVFQVTNILIAELLRTRHCGDLNAVGVPCDPKINYYEQVRSAKTGELIDGPLRRGALMADAQVIQDKMSTNLDMQVSLGLVAMGLTLDRNQNDPARALVAWKTGHDEYQYSSAVNKCYNCVLANGAKDMSCFAQIHKDQSKVRNK